MSNTISAGNTNGQLARIGLSTTLPAVCEASKFSFRATPDSPARSGINLVPAVASTAALGTNVTTFTSGDASIGKIEVTVNHIAKRGHFTHGQTNLGFKTPGHLEDSLTRDMERDLFLAFLALVTGDPDATVAAASFDLTNLETLVNGCADLPRTLLLNTAAMQSVGPDLHPLGNGGYQWPGVANVIEAGLSGAADVALCVTPRSFVYVSEAPESWSTIPPKEVRISEIILPRLQIPVWRCEWHDRPSRATWISFETLFGCAIGDAGAISFASSPGE